MVAQVIGDDPARPRDLCVTLFNGLHRHQRIQGKKDQGQRFQAGLGEGVGSERAHPVSRRKRRRRQGLSIHIPHITIARGLSERKAVLFVEHLKPFAEQKLIQLFRAGVSGFADGRDGGGALHASGRAIRRRAHHALQCTGG